MSDLCYARTIGGLCEIVMVKYGDPVTSQIDRRQALAITEKLIEFIRATEPKDTSRPCDTEAHYTIFSYQQDSTAPQC